MVSRLKKEWQSFEYKHTSITLAIMLATLLFLNTTLAAVILEWFKHVGPIGGFIGGVMSVSMFTTAPALTLIISISQDINPWLLITVATLGSVVGDWLVVKFLEDEVASELKPLLRKFHLVPFIRYIQRSRNRWVVTLVGAIVLALPLPDEFGIALMDISHIKRRTLLAICFVLNFFGITALVMAARAVI